VPPTGQGLRLVAPRRLGGPKLGYTLILGWFYTFGIMRRFVFLLLLAVVVGIGCNKSTRLRVVLVSDSPWSPGEAKWCSLDGKWNEMHCFPPENISAKDSHKYMVNADFDKPPRFDKEQWAHDIVCRLDSYEHATCQSQTK
jgi:hypothetical protein